MAQRQLPSRQCVPMLYAFLGALAPFSVGVWSAWAAQTVLNASQKPTERAWSWTILPREIPWTLCTLNLGFFLGCLPAGYAVNRYGRKWVLISTGFLHLLSWLVVLAADRRSANLYSGRILAGLAAAAAAIAVPTYCAEIASLNGGRLRGSAVALGGVAMAAGSFLAHVLSPLLSYGQFAAVSCVPPAVFIVAFFNSPESPFQLAAVGRTRKAAASVRRLHGTVSDGARLLGRGRSISDTEIEEQEEEKDIWPSWTEIMYNAELRFGAGLAISVMTLPRLAGADTLLTYAAEQLPLTSGANATWPHTGQDLIAGMSGIVLGASVLSAVLVDYVGRRPFLTVSALVAAAAMCSVGAFHVVVDVYETPVTSDLRMWLVASLFVWAAGFGVGMLSIPQLVVAEVLTTSARGLCTAVAVTAAIVASTVVTKAFEAASVKGSLWIVYFTFALFYLVMAAISAIFVPEMKAKPITHNFADCRIDFS